MSINSFIEKLYLKRFILGVSRCDIKEIIRQKTFNPEINWVHFKSKRKFQADPFFIDLEDGNINLLFEEFDFDDHYARIAFISFNNLFERIEYKTILDIKSHLSFPFVFSENKRVYVFPESRRSGSLSCYEFNPEHRTLTYIKRILDLPVEDATITKYAGKYWIFCTKFRKDKIYELWIFHSDNLMGPYTSHSANPVKEGLDGIRSAGALIEVDGSLYRPAQNCKNEYGESITMNKISELSVSSFNEVPYMTVTINRSNRLNRNIHTIHTINVLNDLIVVDGKYWSLSPFYKLSGFIRKQIKAIVE